MRNGVLILICLALAPFCRARTITVDDDGPADFNNIQAAIDDANDGDTVEIQPGTYTGPGNRDIEFLGKAITVRSTDPNDPNIVGATIIDCNASEIDPHRAFYFHRSEQSNSIVAGLTIVNGWNGLGGAVYCDESSPTFSRCTITGNVADGSGGGFYCTNSDLSIIDCSILYNTSERYDGGGICCYWSNLTIANSLIMGNSATGDRGGGICNNRYSDLNITNCVLSHNSGNWGGGIFLYEYCNATVSNCTFTGNSALSMGGGIYSRDCSTRVTNCILWTNTAPEGAEIALLRFRSSSSRLTISYSDVHGGEEGAYVAPNCFLNWGSGNIRVDPQFADPAAADYHLSSRSLCINTGDPDYSSGSTDIDGDPRIINGRVDIGADELPGAGPVFAIPVDRLDFSSLEGRSNPDPQYFTIQNVGPESIAWEITEDCPWLTVSPATGQSAGESDRIDVQVNTSGLIAGSYSHDLIISALEAVNSPQTFTVSLELHGPHIEVSLTDFHFQANQRGPNPPAQILSVRNSSGGRLNWHAITDCNWLTVDPPFGDSVGESDDLSLSVDVGGLIYGMHDCEIVITDPNAVNDPQTISVYLSVSHSALLHVPADYLTIQSAIDSAVYGDAVVIAPGTYTGPGNRDIDFLGKAITVKSQSGPKNCIIDCNGTEADPHRGFIFQSNEDANSLLQGLTITNGYGSLSRFEESYGYGGAILCYFSSPTIAGCVIKGNTAAYGGGIHAVAFPDGVLDMTIRNCVIAENVSTSDNWGPGGGGIRLDGDYGFGFIGRCNLYVSHIRIVNCTIADNNGGGIGAFMGCEISVENSIAWGNTWQGSDAEIVVPNCNDCCPSSVAISHSNIKNGPDGVEPQYLFDWGPGNIDADPCFIGLGYWNPNGTPDDASDHLWVDGDYHLKSQGGRYDPNSASWVIDDVTSPCIDRGDPMSPIGLEPFPNGGIINMGAYGGTAEASKSYFGGPVCETIVAGDINGDCIVDFRDFWLLGLHWMEDNN